MDKTFPDSHIRWQGERGRGVKRELGSKKSREDYEVPWHRRWNNRPGTGKLYKKAYHKARRQANHREAVGGKIGKRIGHVSECKWKGH